VTCASYRNAGLLAKEAACIDVYSGGRLILGWGRAGSMRSTTPMDTSTVPTGAVGSPGRDLEVVRRCGPRRPSPSTAPSALRRRLLRSQAGAEPSPVLVGGAARRSICASRRRADLTNWQVGLESFERKSNLLEQYCERWAEPSSHHPHHGPDCRLFDTEADTLAWCESPAEETCGRHPHRAVSGRQPVGTVEQVVEKTQGFIDAGCRGSSCGCVTSRGRDLRRFMEEVVPSLRVG